MMELGLPLDTEGVERPEDSPDQFVQERKPLGHLEILGDVVSRPEPPLAQHALPGLESVLREQRRSHQDNPNK